MISSDEHLSDLSGHFMLLPNQSYLAEGNDSSSRVLTIDLRKFLLLSDTLQAPGNDTNDEEYADIDIDREALLSGLIPVNAPNVSSDHLTSINNLLPNEFAPLPLPYYEPSFDDQKQLNKRQKNDIQPFLIRTYASEDTTGDDDEAEAADADEQMTLSNAKTVELQNGEKSTGTRPVHDQEDSASQKHVSHASSGHEAYLYTTIENRPIASYQLPHPPLQHEYPKSIQNNYAPSARVVNRPPPSGSTFNPPLPQSLPSVVHEPNAVLALQNSRPVPSSPAIPLPVPLGAATTHSQSTSSQYASYYAAPISSSFSNREHHSQHQPLVKSQPKEKVVVKIVPADGWYLNDENERRSYFNAVAHGLLNENGYVFVNDVQRVGSQPNQNVFSLPSVYQSSQTSQSTSQAQQQAQYQFSQRYGTPQNGAAAPEPRQVSTREISSAAFSSINSARTSEKAYRGRSSYTVPLSSVGKLAGDNEPYNYNLASLRPDGRR